MKLRTREIKIRITGAKYIYAKINGSLRKPVVVFVHGLTGHTDECLFRDAVRYFLRQGFSVFRFNLYDWRKGARNLTDCTLRIHAADLDYVVAWLRRRGAKKIFAVGHSFGGLTILLSHARDVDGIVLWDASYRFLREKGEYIPSLKAYRFRWGTDVLLGKAMAEEVKRLHWDRLTSTLTVPVKVICAGKGMLKKGGNVYFKNAKGQKEFTVIQNANHNFYEDGVADKLYRETIRFLKKRVTLSNSRE